ncbi:hypothetical protein K438DRAFT_1964104 [Mycena galopus ATCC 62051]|nr:hypothetical protein K438DRAFT_1964104 [Mycena galopus ATCC 62051]
MSSFALGPLSNHPPDYQNQYMLVNKEGWLGFAAVNRRILALPPEILTDIFFFCLPFRVCRQWRNIVLSTPQLWSSICFDIDFECEYGPLYVDLVRMWFSRARRIPLWIHWGTFQSSKPSDSLLEIICGLSQQWQDIEFGDTIPLASLPLQGIYPSLERLCIYPPYNHQPILSFRNAPRLRDVYIPEYTTMIQLPLHQLVSFHTDNIDIQECFELFRQATNLVDLRIAFAVADESTEPVPMSLLKTLKTPALKTLTLTLNPQYFWSNGSDLFDTSPFQSFVSQSAFQLHTLTLSHVPNTEALIDYLNAAPTVVHLTLQISDYVGNSNPVFAKLTGHRDFLPKLESLHIALSAHNTHVDASLVVSVLIWRCMTSAVARLQSFQLGVRENSAAEISGAIKSIKSHPVYLELEASGMDLDVGRRTYETAFV